MAKCSTDVTEVDVVKDEGLPRKCTVQKRLIVPDGIESISNFNSHFLETNGS